MPALDSFLVRPADPSSRGIPPWGLTPCGRREIAGAPR